jgi:hypothetical protein
MRRIFFDASESAARKRGSSRCLITLIASQRDGRLSIRLIEPSAAMAEPCPALHASLSSSPSSRCVFLLEPRVQKTCAAKVTGSFARIRRASEDDDFNAQC